MPFGAAVRETAVGLLSAYYVSSGEQHLGAGISHQMSAGRGVCEQAGTTVHLLGPLDRSVGSFGAPVFFTLAAICATGSRCSGATDARRRAVSASPV